MCGTVGGGQATFMARPYAPRKEWLSRMMKAPGSLSFSRLMAEIEWSQETEDGVWRGHQRDRKTKKDKRMLRSFHSWEQTCLDGFVLVSPCSLEMSGLYQNLDVSWTNLTFILMSGYPSARTKKMETLLIGGHSPSGDRRWSLGLTVNGPWDF